MELLSPPTNSSLPISTLALRKAEYKVDSTYQRAPGIWEKWREQYLIDSILRGFGIPLIFIHKKNGEKFIVDGQQRLLTIWKFSENKLELSKKLSSDIIKQNSGGDCYSELNENFKDRFNSYPIPIASLEKYSDEQIRSTFKRLQSGKPLSTGEMLNAYPGDIVPAMRELANHPFLQSKVAMNLENRYIDYKISATLLFLENDGIKSISPNYIYTFFENNRDINKESSCYIETKRTLNYLNRVFPRRTGELRTQAWLVSVYLMASYLNKHYSMSNQKENFNNFIVDICQKIDNVEQYTDLLEFYNRVSKGTNNEESIQYRHDILVKRFLEQYKPIELDEDRLFSDKQKRALYNKFKGECQQCSKGLDFGDSNTHYHHIAPFIKGGKTEIENGLLLCKDCHLTKFHGTSS